MFGDVSEGGCGVATLDEQFGRGLDETHLRVRSARRLAVPLDKFSHRLQYNCTNAV